MVIERKLLSSLHLWGILYSDNLSPPGHLPWLETAGNVLSQAEFSAWLSSKYLMLNHLCSGKTGTESPGSLMEVDECVALVHLEEKQEVDT